MQPLPANNQQNPQYLYQDQNLLIIFGVSLIAVLGVASITPTFPQLTEALKIPTQNIGWLVTVFIFPAVVLGRIIGVLADRFGRKSILVPSLILFGIAGVACAFVRDFNLLLWLRFLQGIGAASLLSLSVTLIGDLYTAEKRTTAMGHNASVSSIGTAIYPTIGEALAVVGWYYPFMLSAVAIPVGLLVLFKLKNPEPQGQRNFRAYLRNAVASLKNRQIVGLFIAKFSSVFYVGVGFAIATLVVFRYCNCMQTINLSG